MHLAVDEFSFLLRDAPSESAMVHDGVKSHDEFTVDADPSGLDLTELLVGNIHVKCLVDPFYYFVVGLVQGAFSYTVVKLESKPLVVCCVGHLERLNFG